MTDLDRHRLRGLVHTMRTETAEWDAATDSWKPPSGYQLFTFRADGNVSHSESRYRGGVNHLAHQYDAAGRLIAIESWGEGEARSRMEFRYDASGRPAETFLVAADGAREQTETFSYDSDGRMTRLQHRAFAGLPEDVAGDAPSWQRYVPHGSEPSPSPLVTVLYDAANRPSEVLIHSASHEFQYRVLLTRDKDGRLLTAETTFAGLDAFGPGLQAERAKASPEDRAKMESELETIFEKQMLQTVHFSYDTSGRLIEETLRMGTVMEDVRTYRYDERDTVVEETYVTRSRVIDGAPGPEVEDRRGRTRFEYQRDTHGNWTERVALGDGGDATDFRRGTIERRALTYYAG